MIGFQTGKTQPDDWEKEGKAYILKGAPRKPDHQDASFVSGLTVDSQVNNYRPADQVGWKWSIHPRARK